MGVSQPHAMWCGAGREGFHGHLAGGLAFWGGREPDISLVWYRVYKTVSGLVFAVVWGP